MAESLPEPISSAEKRRRMRRIRRCTERLGFVGKVEYRHVLSTTGGAQYGIAPSPDKDLLVVFADAFQRDADPDDFSLEAILAHERGHQMLIRQPNLQCIMERKLSLISDEILASLLGSLIAEVEQDRELLYYKAVFEAVTHGMETDRAVRLLHDLRCLLEKTL